MNASSQARPRISRRDIKRVRQEADACIYAMNFAAGARGESVGLAYMQTHVPIETHMRWASEASERAFRIATLACEDHARVRGRGMSAVVNVRGVIRATIEELRASGDTGMVQNLLDADAAVAELIEVAKEMAQQDAVQRATHNTNPFMADAADKLLSALRKVGAR